MVNDLPEKSVVEVAEMRLQGEDFILLDVREPMELSIASLGDEVLLAPLSQIAARYEDALPEEMEDKSVEVVVVCHHGNRSAQVTAWLLSNGWSNVYNMVGGIDAYAREVDPTINLY